MQRTQQDPHVILVLFEQLDVYGPGELQFLITEVTSQIAQIRNSPDALQIVYSGLSLGSLSASFVDKQQHVSPAILVSSSQDRQMSTLHMFACAGP